MRTAVRSALKDFNAFAPSGARPSADRRTGAVLRTLLERLPAARLFVRVPVGAHRAAELTLTGRIVKAEEARSLGILLEVTEPERLLPRAREIAGEIAAKPPLAVRYAKRALRLARHQGLEEHLESCASFQGALQKTEDHLEALAAFFEKRAGQFKGK